MRVLEKNESPLRQQYELARMEDVSQEELMKRYMEEVKENVVEKSDDEIRIEEEHMEAAEMMAFLGMEGVQLNTENPLAELTEMCAESYKETILASQEDPEYKSLVKELNEKQGIFEIDLSKDWTDHDDPLLEKQFERESQKISSTLTARASRKRLDKDSTMKDWDNAFAAEEEVSQSFNNKTSTDSGYRSGSTFDQARRQSTSSSTSSGFRTASAKSETVGYSKTTDDPDYERRQENRGKCYAKVSGQMLDVAYKGDKKVKKPRKKRAFGAREKFSFRGLWNKTKEWFHTDEAVLGAKIGAMLCLQTGMAVMNKRLEFDGTLQALSFVGMALAVFFVGREVRAEGFDARTIQF